MATTTTSADVDEVLRDVTASARPAAADGEAATYIPPLAHMDPQRFAIAAVEMDGTEHATGDADVAFSTQSISKVFSLVLALQKAQAAGDLEEVLWRRVGREPSGDPFNSLVQLEHERGVPRNPMINAGSLVVDDVLMEYCGDARADVLALVSELAGEAVGIDEEVYRAEAATGHRNQALAHLMAGFGNLVHPVDDVLELYYHHCAISATARQLARSVRFLANDGVDPATGHTLLSPSLARRVAAIMLTCGTYDAAGEFAFSVGLPCKSGVAGGIVALVPDWMGLCVWSPPLERSGSSLAGRIALHDLAERLDLSIF